MKLKLWKASCLPIVFILLTLTITSCKKDKLEVNEYIQVLEVAPSDLAGGAMHLILNPDGTADITPGGDISYRGSYKISGSMYKG